MTYRSNDPVADHARNVLQNERIDARTIRTLKLDDVLKQPVSIDGLPLDSHVTVIVRQAGTHEMEIDYCDVRSVHVNATEIDFAWSPIEIFNFEAKHKSQYKKFVAAVEAEAIRQAKAAPDSDWSYESDEV